MEPHSQKAESAPSPSLIHQDLDLIVRTIRDFFSADTERVVVDSPRDHRRITDFVRNFMPRLKSKIVLYADKVPLFEQQGSKKKSPRRWSAESGCVRAAPSSLSAPKRSPRWT